MIGEILNTIIHYVGNKSTSDGVRFSTEEVQLGDLSIDLSKLIDKSFKTDVKYQFFFEPILTLNPLYVFINNIFNKPSTYIKETQNIARFLYENSTHPKIKSGELWVMYISNCLLDGTYTDAICILKSETKESVLHLNQLDSNYEVVKYDGLGLNKIDKGCLIFNSNEDSGYVCSIIDNGSKKGDEAIFWVDDFLHVRPILNDYQKTKVVVDAIATYVNDELPKYFEINKSDKALIINNTLSEIKSKEEITLKDIKDSVFVDNAVREDLERYIDNYQVENNIILDENSIVEKSAIKGMNYNSILTIKLDKNFDVKIHGGEKYIERGYDDDMKMNYYKLYFRKEK